MAGVDVCVYGDEEALVELKGTWELLGQLPHTLQELVDDRRHLFRIPVQVSVPAGTQFVLTVHHRKHKLFMLCKWTSRWMLQNMSETKLLLIHAVLSSFGRQLPRQHMTSLKAFWSALKYILRLVIKQFYVLF